MSYHWDNAENEYLARRVKEGAKASVIADEMGKTYRAVKARMNRVGLTRQSSLKGRWEREDDRLLIDLRKEARERKDYATGDAIRDRLTQLGVALLDKKEGTSWERSS